MMVRLKADATGGAVVSVFMRTNHMFKTLPLVERTCREETLPDAARGFARDTITLGWEERLKTRARRRSDAGAEFVTSLPRGTVLRSGDRLVVGARDLVIEVVERPEPAFVIEPQTAAEWGLFAYHIGNGHQPLMITERALVCPDVPGVEMLLQYHQIPYTQAEMPFTPSTTSGHLVI